jgi:LPXTG-motif cell wall-anchored protein
MRRIKSAVTLAVMVLLVMAMGIGTAAAQEAYPPPPGDLVVDCVAAGQAGASVTCTVTGAQPGEQLTVTAKADGTVFYTEVLSANMQGEATFRFTVPPQHRGQQITVTVAGAISGAAEDTLTIRAPGRTGETLPRAMPRTGQDTILLAAAGVLLLGAGATALRRRQRTSDRDRTHAGV